MTNPDHKPIGDTSRDLVGDPTGGRPEPASVVRIEYDPWDQDAMRQARAHVDRAVEDTVAAMRRREGIVRITASEAEIRYIARAAARLALLMDRNPDRPNGAT